MDANLRTTTFVAIATKLIMDADLGPFTFLALSGLLTMLTDVFPATFCAEVFLSAMGTVILGGANHAIPFAVKALSCLHPFFLAMNTTFTLTAVAVNLIVLSSPFHLTSSALKEHSTLYVTFSHFGLNRIRSYTIT